jgi:dienelactone hydrolase
MKAFTLGFCLGGMLAAQFATRDTELKAVVVFYGNLPKSEQDPLPYARHFW